MRILFFNQNLRAGGRERRLVELFKYLKRSGECDIELVITKDVVHYPEFFELGIPLHVIERKWIKKDPMLFFSFFRIARQFRPDIIHVWSHMTAVYALPAALLLRVPLINNEIVDSTVGLPLPLKGLVFRVSRRVIGNSIAGLEAYGAPAGKSRVIYNGFSFDRLKNMESEVSVKERFGIRTPLTVAMVASFLELKDYATYLTAAVKLASVREDVTFLCIGDGDDTDSRKLVPPKLSGRIIFTGRQEKVEQIMNVCQIGVLTTNIKAHGEGISNALLEFMALGKPVIATDHGGSRELVEHSVTGYLVDAFDPEGLAQKIGQLLDDQGLREKLGAAAREAVKTKFSMDRMFSDFFEEYNTAMASGPGSKPVTP